MAYSDKDYDFDLFMPKSQKNQSEKKPSGPSSRNEVNRRRGTNNTRYQGSINTSASARPRTDYSSHRESDNDLYSSTPNRNPYNESRNLSSNSGRRPVRRESNDISSISDKRRAYENRKAPRRKTDYVFGKNAEQNNASKSRRGKKRKMGALGRAALSVGLVILITGLLVIGIFSVYVFAFVDGTLDYQLTDLKLDYTSVMYANDENGNSYELAGVHSTENRIWVNYEDVPKHFYDAVVSIEDKRFYSHGGVDWYRTFYSFANLILKFDKQQGGSTLTQQLVKNLTGDDDVSAMRKIQEIMRARYVEKEYSKEVILECYVNVIAYGNGCYGIETASQYYFGHPASELTLEESAALAALIKSPSTMNPKTAPENNKERRNYILSLMLDQEYISEEEYEEAKNAELKVVSGGKTTSNITVNTWYEDYVIKDVINDLCEQYGYTEGKAQNLIYNGGLKIYTTYNASVQSAIDEVYANPANFLRIKRYAEDPQSGLVVMDYQGHILGMMGGYGTKEANMLFNMAVDAKRPTGSSIKPLSAYSPSIEFNAATFSTIIEDAPIKLNDGTMWPKNSDGKYRGNTYLWDGLRRSVNTVAVRLVQNMTPQKAFDYLVNRYHMTTLVSARQGSNGKVLTDISLGPMAIGSLTDGETVLDMTAAFACFGNLGYYYEPTSYTKVTDKNGVILLEYEVKAESAISEDTATIMNKMLQSVVNSGTASKGKFDGWQLFGKTGTTPDTKDLWFVGGSAYYICGCWYGYKEPKSMAGMSMNPALKVWNAVMKKAHSGLAKKTFAVSNDVTYRYYCTETGLLATDTCPSAQLGWYKTSYLPACTTHKGNLLKEQTLGAKAFSNPNLQTPEGQPPAENETERNANTVITDE